MNRSESNRSQPSRKAQQAINALISFGTSIVVACGVMMWSVFNAWTNVLTYWANEQEGQAWLITVVMVLLTSVVPFAGGIWLLIRTVSKYQPKETAPPARK